MTKQDEIHGLAFWSKIQEIDLVSAILRESLVAEQAAMQLNKDLLELMRERSLVLEEYERRMAACYPSHSSAGLS